MKKGDIAHGFRVTNVRDIKELNAAFVEMTHEKSGASLVWLDRTDANKTFSVAFKTIPDDSTGVFHILEHSVLGGSDKYPVKEPFVELLKSSVQTFLNAMTYPDKTVYPVSSRNDKDFLNLVDVYLDGVFHPSIYHKPEIFRQEGWRYEIADDGSAVYQGVVFNEMKGAYSSPDAVLEHELMKSLFPDNTYGCESGGHPEHIPDLTYGHFIEMHKKFYHPSNARISLCGSVDIDSVLPLIDSYLREYDSRPADFEIPMQSPVKYAEKTVEYEIGADEPAASKAIIAFGSVFGTFADQEKIIAACVLSDYLAGDNDSPLKRAILDKKLGQDMRVSVFDGIQQPFITWQVWNTDESKLEEIKEAVDSTLRSLVENGLDRESLKASFNRFSFRLRDKEGGGVPRSLAEALNMLDTWLYGGDPAAALCVEASLSSLESNIENGGFENILRELLIDTPHSCLVTLAPSQKLGEIKRQKESARLAAESAGWTPEQLAALREQQRVLTEWQQSPDSAEALATIPLLKISDLDPKPGLVTLRETALDGVTLLRHETGSPLSHATLHFNAADVSLAELPAFSLLCSVLGKFATASHGSTRLQMLVKQNIGRLSFHPDIYPGSDALHSQTFASVAVSCLKNRVDEAFALISEILCTTRFDDKKQLRDLLNQFAMEMQMSLTSRGNRFAVTRAGAHVTSHGSAREAVSGYTYAEWLKKQSTASDESLDSLLETLKGLASRLFTAERLVAGASETVSDSSLSALFASFARGRGAPGRETAYAPLPGNGEGIIIPAGVGFAAKCTNMYLHGRKFNGSILAMANILNYSYLWNEIRVQGGAYGCGFIGRDDGDVCCYSYRDPQPGRSLDIFDGASAFIREFCAERPDITKHILGSVTDLDPLLNTEQKMSVAESRWFKGVSYDEICGYYTQLLNTRCEDLLALCDMLEDIAGDDVRAVVAGKAQIDDCGDKVETRLSL